MDFTDSRLSYDKNSLSENNLPNDPFDLFQDWMSQAINNDTPEPYAMSIATCGADNMPSVRTVLLREVTPTGIVFYTNYLSEKGEDLAQNPNAEALFFWHDMERQVRIRGQVQKVSRAKTQAYFAKRPHDSQLGAWVSEPQSGVVESREHMQAKFAKLKEQYPEGMTVPVPEFWGGYELTVQRFEFWQGRPNRLHDRICYQVGDEQAPDQTNWRIERLLP